MCQGLDPRSNVSLQIDALNAAGCERIFCDTGSGAAADRPQLLRMLDYARPGDTVVVWRLDRLGRSLKNLIDLVTEFDERDAGLRSLHEVIDTTTPSGRLVMHVFGALAEFERELIRERTRAGLAAARARGRRGGRKSVMTPDKTEVAKQMLASGDHTVTRVAAVLGVSRQSVYRALGSGATVGRRRRP